MREIGQIVMDFQNEYGLNRLASVAILDRKKTLIHIRLQSIENLSRKRNNYEGLPKARIVGFMKGFGSDEERTVEYITALTEEGLIYEKNGRYFSRDYKK